MSTSESKRVRYQRTASGGFLSEPVHPLDKGRRIRLVRDSLPKLLRDVEHVRDIGRDLEIGAMSVATAMRMLSGIQRGHALLLSDAWISWLPTLDHETRCKADSTWTHQIGPFLGDKACFDLDERVMRIWQRELEARYAPKTIHGTYWMLHAALRLAVSSKLLEEIPWGEWRVPAGEVRTPRAVASSLDDLVAIVNVALAHDAQLWARGRLGDLAFRVLVIFYVGARQGEGCALGWDHWDAARRILTVKVQAKDGWRKRHPEWTRPLFPTKGRRSHAVAVHDVVFQVLELQRKQLARLGIYRDDGPIFPSTDRGKWRSNATCVKPELFKDLVRTAGIANLANWSPHSLRHSKATLEHGAGAAVKDVQLMIGHSDEHTTRMYIHSIAPPPAPPSRLASMALPGTVFLRTAMTRFEEADTEPAPRPLLVAAAPPPPEPARDLGMYELARLVSEGDVGPTRRERPKEITDAAERAYVKAYKQSLRDKPGDLAEARKLGRAARARYLGTWMTALARVAREGSK